MKISLRRILGKVTGGIIGGEKPKDVIEEVVKDTAEEFVQDKLQDAGLPIFTDAMRNALGTILVDASTGQAMNALNDKERVHDRFEAIKQTVMKVLTNEVR